MLFALLTIALLLLFLLLFVDILVIGDLLILVCFLEFRLIFDYEVGPPQVLRLRDSTMALKTVFVLWIEEIV